MLGVTADFHSIEITSSVSVTPDLQSGALFGRISLVSLSGVFGGLFLR
jgi:hypothetical protein